jgi:hypothetical protein
MTALTLLNLIDTPLGELISAVPLGWSAMGCFTRIQAFLVQDSRFDRRVIQERTPSNNQNSVAPERSQDEFELRSLGSSSKCQLIKVENGTFGWSDSIPNVVKNVNIHVPMECKLTFLVGPIACGKVSAHGVIHQSAKVLPVPFIKVDSASCVSGRDYQNTRYCLDFRVPDSLL